MTERHIFHLAIPVKDLTKTKHFYLDTLNAKVGRENDEWLDIMLWGHQITLHKRPDEVLGKDEQGKRHFGVVLPWSEWEDLSAQFKGRKVNFLSEPKILKQGCHDEQAKMFFQDPSNNIIEVKAYRDFNKTFNLS